MALYLEQGLGKSKILLDTAAYQFVEDGIAGLVVVSRTVVVGNWAHEEVPKHLGVPHNIIYYTTKSKGKLPPISTLRKDRLNVLLINDGCLRTKHGYEYVKKFMTHLSSGLAVDESTLIKNPAAGITRKVSILGEKAVYRRIMCGEPAPQGPQDYYSQYKFLHRDILGCSTFTAFKNMYCQQQEIWINGRAIKKPTRAFAMGRKEFFEDRVRPFTIRLRKADVLAELPEKQFIQTYYDLSPQEAKAYSRLRDEYLTEWVTKENTGLITAPMAIQRITRLHQLATGYLVTDEGEAIDTSASRLDVLGGILNERPAGKKTIIWAHYRRNVEQVGLYITDKVAEDNEYTVHIYGGMSPDERQDALSRFKTDPECRWLVANQASGSWGLTLTEADCAIYYSNSYNWEHRRQSEDRIHRIGQESESVTYYDIIAQGTVDERILSVLNEKANFSESVFKDFAKWLAPIGDK